MINIWNKDHVLLPLLNLGKSIAKTRHNSMNWKSQDSHVGYREHHQCSNRTKNAVRGIQTIELQRNVRQVSHETYVWKSTKIITNCKAQTK
uniref:Uncharacterized protein n=1 Tax=Rhizophora mucronata TaxID=61149 RepID=A0A2P2QM26_RHIMU